MTFVPASGKWSTIKAPKKAAVTYTAGMIIYNDATDNVPATTTTQQNILGILKETVASSAATTAIHIAAPQSVGCTFYGDLTSGESITKANEGDPFDFASGGLTVSTTSTYDVVTLVKFISSSKGVFKLNYTTGVEN